MVVLDTSIIIDHLRTATSGESHLLHLAKAKPKETLALSVISVQELYEGHSTRNKEKEKSLLATIAPLGILPYTYETAKLAGQIARDLGRTVELADAAIAATTIFHNAQLYTLDKRGFAGIRDLELL